MELTFASWNLWDYGLQRHHAEQEHLVHQVIAEVQPDVLAVQEICGSGRGPTVLRKLAGGVGMECTVPTVDDDADDDVAIAHASGNPDSRFHVGLLWRPGLFSSPPVLDRPADGELWHNLITLTGSIAGTTMRFASFHGRPFGMHARADEFERVVAAVARTYHGTQPPTLIGADWNATSADIVPAGDGLMRYHQRDPFTRPQQWDPAWLYQCRTTMHLATGELSWSVDRDAAARLRDGGLHDVAARLDKPEQPTCGYGPSADMPPRTVDQIRATTPMLAAATDHTVLGGDHVESASDHRLLLTSIDTDLLGT